MKSIFKFINKYKYIIFMFFSFFVLDFSLRYFTKSINFYNIYKIVPNLFTIGWIILFIGISISIKSKYGKIIYIFFVSLSLLLFLTHSIYYSYFKNFFDFSSLQYAGEAGSYMIDALKNSKLWVFVITVIDILLIYFSIKFYPKKKKSNFKLFLITFLVFILIHIFTPYILGKSVNTWDAWRNPRNIYISFNDNNRSMQVAGFYEYNIRNLYVNYFKEEVKIEDEDTLLKEKFIEDIPYENEYTGMFKDKNVIFVQLEGIDKFLVTEEIMPTLYSLKNNSINFNDHYSFVNGGGSTFNSEFMINVGYTTPITINKGAYTFSKNTYTYSLPNLFKKAEYNVNAFHMNTPEYYSRSLNYKSFGYNSFNSLKALENGKYYTDNTYWLDTELINNPSFNEMIFNTEEKFMDYIITYSTHMPFQIDKGVCNLLVEDHETQLTEYECLKIQAKETDDMIRLLIDNLEEKELIDNTILVLFADHYLYTLTDKTLLDEYKITENNLINNTDWMIWSNNMDRIDIDKVTSQLNILPTILNLFGLEYHPNYYLMPDALDNDYKSLVFFNDYSWYDGNVYVSNGVVTNNGHISEEELLEKSEKVNDLIKINDSILTTDYFKGMKKSH